MDMTLMFQQANLSSHLHRNEALQNYEKCLYFVSLRVITVGI